MSEPAWEAEVRSPGADASRSVLGRGLIYTIGAAAPILSNAVVTPAVTRSVGSQAYGAVATALVIIQVGMIVAGLGLAAAIMRHGILERTGVEGARSLLLRGAFASAVLCGIAAAAAPWAHHVFALQEPAVLALALAASAGFATVVNVQSYLRVIDRPGLFVSLSLTSALGGPLLGLLLVRLVSRTAEAYVTGLALGLVVSGLAGLAMALREGHLQHAKGDTRRALRIGLPTVPHQVAIFLASGALVLVAGRLFDSTQAGRFQLAVLIGSAPGIVSASLNNAWAPIVYRAPESDRADVLEHTGQNIAFLTALAAGFVACAAPFLLAMVAPPSYDPGALTAAVGVVAAGTVLSVPYLCNVHLVFVSGRIGGLAVVTPFSLVVGTLAAWVGAEAFGLSGIGVGMPVTYSLMALGTGVLARRVSSTRWHYRVLVTPTLLGFALCALGAVLPTTGAAMIARIVLTAGTVGFSLLVFRRAFAS